MESDDINPPPSGHKRSQSSSTKPEPERTRTDAAVSAEPRGRSPTTPTKRNELVRQFLEKREQRIRLEHRVKALDKAVATASTEPVAPEPVRSVAQNTGNKRLEMGCVYAVCWFAGICSHSTESWCAHVTYLRDILFL